MTIKSLLFTYGALLTLLIATVFFAYVRLGWLNLPVALMISTAKAALIIFMFMELGQALPTTKLLVGTLLLWAAFFGVLGSADYFTRQWKLSPRVAERPAVRPAEHFD